MTPAEPVTSAGIGDRNRIAAFLDGGARHRIGYFPDRVQNASIAMERANLGAYCEEILEAVREFYLTEGAVSPEEFQRNREMHKMHCMSLQVGIYSAIQRANSIGLPANVQFTVRDLQATMEGLWENLIGTHLEASASAKTVFSELFGE